MWIIVLALLTFALMAIIAIMLAAANNSDPLGFNAPPAREGTFLCRDGTLGGPNRTEHWRRF